MMKIAFSISSPVEKAIPKLIAKVSSFKCRVQVDLKHGTVVASDVDPLNFDNVIEAVDNCFEITGVDIDTTDVVFEVEKPVVEANYADDLFFQASSNINIGDIVECHYGNNLDSEISGNHVHALVCDFINNTAFVIPITKQIIDEQFSLPFSSDKDVVYDEPNKYIGGTLLLNRGCYVGIERLHKVIGRALPEFFDEVIETLPEAYCFESISTHTSYDEESVEDFKAKDTTVANTVVDSQTEVKLINVATDDLSENDTINQTAETEIASTNTDIDFSKFENFEDTLSALIGMNIQSLNKNSDLEPQLDNFLTSIGFSNAILVKQAFIAAYKVEKVKYDSIIIELKNQNPHLMEDEIKQTLRDAFKIWISNYPTIMKQFPRISIISLLKFFVKSYK